MRYVEMMDPGWQRELARPIRLRTCTISTLDEARLFIDGLSAATRAKTPWRLASVMLDRAVAPEGAIKETRIFYTIFCNALKAEGLMGGP